MKMKNLFLLDFKGLWKGLRYFYLAVFVFDVLAVINLYFDNPILNVVMGMLTALVFYGFALVFTIYYGIHFYRTMISKQATLYHTLPVPKSMLIGSKILAFISHYSLFSFLAFMLPFITIYLSGRWEHLLRGDLVEMGLQPTPELEAGLTQSSISIWDKAGEVGQGQWISVGVLGLLVILLGFVASALFIQTILQVQADSRFQKMGVGGSVLAFFVIMFSNILLIFLCIFGAAMLAVEGRIFVGYTPTTYLQFFLLAYILYLLVFDGLLYWFNLNSMKKHLSL